MLYKISETDALSWNNYLAILKVINCTSKPELEEILKVNEWCCPEEFDTIFSLMQKNLFAGLCLLDDHNINTLFTYAHDKWKNYRKENK